MNAFLLHVLISGNRVNGWNAYRPPYISDTSITNSETYQTTRNLCQTVTDVWDWNRPTPAPLWNPVAYKKEKNKKIHCPNQNQPSNVIWLKPTWWLNCNLQTFQSETQTFIYLLHWFYHPRSMLSIGERGGGTLSLQTYLAISQHTTDISGTWETPPESNDR